ncbi:MAG: hypothetical protein ABI779_13270, partial [Acidobacteriota bacterium]
IPVTATERDGSKIGDSRHGQAPSAKSNAVALECGGTAAALGWRQNGEASKDDSRLPQTFRRSRARGCLAVLEDRSHVALFVEAGDNHNSVWFDGVVEGVREGPPDEDSSEAMIGVGVTVGSDTDTPDGFVDVLAEAATETGLLAVVPELGRDKIALRTLPKFDRQTQSSF